MVYVRNKKLLYPELSYKLYGIIFQVHNELGRFKNEKQYGDAIEKLLQDKNIKYEREYYAPVSFKGESAGRNKIDFFIEKQIVIELKVKTRLENSDYYQLRRYLDTLNCELGILVNFRRHAIVPKRILNTRLHSEYSDK